MKSNKLRAIDVYSGVGGWSLGLRMASIDVVASYEKWDAANITNLENGGHNACTADIRTLALTELPKDIDIVVGSPPCTQFSYSNRGGGGDVDDGLVDIIRFLTIVEHAKPKFWAMENVPRVAALLSKELQPKGRLARFSKLGMSIRVIRMDEFGLPQKRTRCIAGNLNFDLLDSYRSQLPRPTLGNIIEAVQKTSVIDPIYAIKLRARDLVDHDPEDFLSTEEVRVNRASKVTHPIYNSMRFPDPMDRPVRTITATCTRVSRESVVIQDAELPEKLRRLTIRERACLQGFPITFQFFGGSYAQKLKMVGNALPPLFAFYVGQSIRGVSPKKLLSPTDGIKKFNPTTTDVPMTPPDRVGTRFPCERRFRFAIPSLRLKSGVRFELRNSFFGEGVWWEVAFVFGSSKSIHEMETDSGLPDLTECGFPKTVARNIHRRMDELARFVREADVAHMQGVWSRRHKGPTHPFAILDNLDQAGGELIALLTAHEELARVAVRQAIKRAFRRRTSTLAGLGKLDKYAVVILAGMLLRAAANAEFTRHGKLAANPPRRLVRGRTISSPTVHA